MFLTMGSTDCMSCSHSIYCFILIVHSPLHCIFKHSLIYYIRNVNDITCPFNSKPPGGMDGSSKFNLGTKCECSCALWGLVCL